MSLTQRREEPLSCSFKLFPDLSEFTGHGWILPAVDTHTHTHTHNAVPHSYVALLVSAVDSLHREDLVQVATQ